MTFGGRRPLVEASGTCSISMVEGEYLVKPHSHSGAKCKVGGADA